MIPANNNQGSSWTINTRNRIKHPLKRIAIVGRGESALRLIRAVRELNREEHVNLTTVIFFAESDRQSLFVREADEAVCIGPATFVDRQDGQLKSSYQHRTRIEEALLAAQVSSVWPGWDIQASDFWLAALCERLGMTFIGPEADVIRLLSDRTSARQLALHANISVVSSREDGIENARHLEVQVISDLYGTTWAIDVRNCTISTRGQRVLEESGSYMLPSEKEQELRESAIRLCQLAGYRNAGIVRFLYDPIRHNFWFMEVEPCLSRGHPITEVTTGLDLLKLQLDVASGKRLIGEPPAPVGHAIAAHLYAESLDNGVASPPVRLELFHLASGPGLRLDTGYEYQDLVHSGYDPALATLTAWGRSRQEAHARLNRALTESKIILRKGMSNKAFLLDLLHRSKIGVNQVDTSLSSQISDNEEFYQRQYPIVALLQSAIEVYDSERCLAESEFFASAARGRPRVRQIADFPTHFQYRGLVYKLKISRLSPDQYRVTLSPRSIEVHVERLGTFERRLTCFGRRYRVLSLINGPDCYVEIEGIPYRIMHEEGGLVRSPSPAVVVSVTVTPGDHVNAGDQLALVESMKMEMTITAPFQGTVVQVFVTSNAQVDLGAPLIHLEPSAWVDTTTDIGPMQFEDAVHTAEVSNITIQARCQKLFEALRCQMLGYDSDPGDSRQCMSEQRMIYQLIEPSNKEVLHAENELLSIFADICLLFRRELDPAEVDEMGEQVHSAEHDLLAYLRSRDIHVERLPVEFIENLQQALAHYGLKSLKPSPALDESLFLIYKSHQQVKQHLAIVIAILERRLEHVDELATLATSEMHLELDRLLLAMQGRYSVVYDLVRQVRFRYFEEPHFEEVRNRVYEEMESHLSYLSAHPDSPNRGELINTLIACPQPLQHLLMRRFSESKAESDIFMLDVLTRRYYRTRFLEGFESTTIDGQPIVKAMYDDKGRHVIVVTTFTPYAHLGNAAATLSHFVNRFSTEHEIVSDFYTWRSEPLSKDDTTAQEILGMLNQISFPQALQRIVVVVSAFGKDPGIASTQHFTYRPAENGFQEDTLYRRLHPMMGERHHIWRLSNFQIERLPSAEDVYLFHGIARTNPKDERLFALAEVRDITPLRDESGKIIRIPQLERMLMEALEGIRLYQSHLPTQKRLAWNRVLLYVWPPLGLFSEEFLELMRKLWPATEGLGLERIVIHAKIPDPEAGELRSRMLHISNPGGRELVFRESGPIETPIATLSEYRQKIVQLRQRGLVYPYEIIEMLTPEPQATHTRIPPGKFTEYDLNEDNHLIPVDRPYGKNKAGIVVGIIHNYTSKYPEGMTRVILLGDPSHSLGSVAEQECRRIIEALNLAEKLQVPLEWFTLSAGAKISMESGTENMDWVARALRRIIEFTQKGFEINVVINGINVGAQPYWNAEATMLMHTRGILIMTANGAMVLTGKQSLDYSGGVSAEDNYGIGGYEQIMGPNGQAQYFALDLSEACHTLMRHYDHTYVLPGEPFPRRAHTTDPATRDVRNSPYFSMRPEDSNLTCLGDLFSDEKNAARKHPFDIRTVMWAIIDSDHQPLERWHDFHSAETAVVWDAHIGGFPVAMLGIESRPLPRRGFVPSDGPEQWTAGTLFPLSAKKAARAINSASGNRSLVVIANLSGFDGSPESMRNLELEYGAEVGRAITNFKGPIIFCVVSRYHGGSFVVFSKALNENLEVAAVAGSYASVIGGIPAAAVVFAHEVETRTKSDPRVKNVQEQLAQAEGTQRSALQVKLNEVSATVRSEKVGEVASEFDQIHNVQRAKRVGSIDHVIEPEAIRPYLIEALERGINRELRRIAR
ncbi:MAG TPA: carboxyl transferase domain-containing protein [Ktedonobacteraceae bacterium]|nr:carboxyl transferase domain-containing protein [Ktedonobacteraceae bacterium]